MAQSIEYWYNLIIAEKQTFASLNAYQPNIDSYQTLLIDLKSTSKVARWRLLVWCVAVCAFSLDVLFSLFRIEIATLIAAGKYGTLPWYTLMAKEFQYGDNLIWSGTEFGYAILDETKQVIKRAAAKKAPGTVILKIANYVGGLNTKLNSAQLAAALVYFDLRTPPGIQLNVINADPDEIKAYARVYVDPLVLNPANGESILSPGVFPAEDAAKAYIDSLNDAFNGIFEVDKFINAIQAANGVTDAYWISGEGRTGTDPYVPIVEQYEPYAGHMKIAVADPLNTTFTYLQDV